MTKMLRMMAMAGILLCATGAAARADLIIGSTVTSASSYTGYPYSFLTQQIFFPPQAILSGSGIEFSTADKLAQHLYQSYEPLTADLTPDTITITYAREEGGFTGALFNTTAWHFSFTDLSVANGESISGLTLLSDTNVGISSVSTTANSLTIDVRGFSNLDQGPPSVTYRIDFQAGTVPEPSSFAMVGTGVVGMLGYGWRRRKAPRGQGR
jgi:hypothetical protein